MEHKEKTNWAHHLLQWRESGKSKREYCTEHSLNTHTFDYHVYKHKYVESVQSESAAKNQFTRIELTSEQQTLPEKIELHFADGRKVFLPMSTPHKTVRLIFSVK